jgi:hypothetical protein
MEAFYDLKKVSLSYEKGVGFIITDKTGRKKVWNDGMIDLASIIADNKNKFRIDAGLFHKLPTPEDL